MAYRELPELNAQTTVSIDAAKQDRMELWLGKWTIEATADQAREVMANIAGFTLSERIGTGRRRRVRLFTEVQDRHGLKVKFLLSVVR